MPNVTKVKICDFFSKHDFNIIQTLSFQQKYLFFVVFHETHPEYILFVDVRKINIKASSTSDIPDIELNYANTKYKFLFEQGSTHSDVKKMYKNINLGFNHYEQINLDEVTDPEMLALKRQTTRLLKCVYNINYKLLISNTNYINFINQKNEVECYYANSNMLNVSKGFYLTTSIKFFIDNPEKIKHNIQQIYGKMDKNFINNVDIYSNQVEDTKIYNLKQKVYTLITELKKYQQLYTENEDESTKRKLYHIIIDIRFKINFIFLIADQYIADSYIIQNIRKENLRLIDKIDALSTNYTNK